MLAKAELVATKSPKMAKMLRIEPFLRSWLSNKYSES